MGKSVLVLLLSTFALALAGCEKSAPSQSANGAARESMLVQFDACQLLAKHEIEAIQGSPIKETKSSAHSDGDLHVSQCFYTAAESNRSVNLALIQRNPDQRTKRSPRDFWKETFDREQGAPREEKEVSAPPKKIDGIGDEAYWTSNRFGGILYVLKNDVFISISVGGLDSEENKINKSKALAQKALKRL
jgi:hypothetical protein